jgi:hypothetical protein
LENKEPLLLLKEKNKCKRGFPWIEPSPTVTKYSMKKLYLQLKCPNIYVIYFFLCICTNKPVGFQEVYVRYITIKRNRHIPRSLKMLNVIQHEKIISSHQDLRSKLKTTSVYRLYQWYTVHSQEEMKINISISFLLSCEKYKEGSKVWQCCESGSLWCGLKYRSDFFGQNIIFYLYPRYRRVVSVEHEQKKLFNYYSCKGRK